MKPKRLLIVFCVLCLTSSCLWAQDSSIVNLARNNRYTFSPANETFTGSGWDTLMKHIQRSDNVLVGEDHFTSEIPFFISAVAGKTPFDNFFCEIDPYSAKTIESKIQTLPGKQLRSYVQEFGNVFSFFALQPEFRLLEQMVQLKTSIYGLDQVLLVADRLIGNELKQTTRNPKAKKIYERIEERSKTHFAQFLKDQGQPFYMYTPGFEHDIKTLLQYNISKDEREKVEALALTAKIYQEQNHHLRVQLMKNNLMKLYPVWAGRKNLFKFGANHLAKGESLLRIYDIGNLVNNIADSRFKPSLHIMIVGKSGTQASPFKGFPEQVVNEHGDNLKSLKPFFGCVTTGEWHCFDLRPVRNALESGKITVNDIELSRIIKGYDFLVIIPKVTAAKFPTAE